MLKKFVLSLVLVIALVVTGRSQKQYIQNYKAIADSLSKVYAIPAKIILSVAVIESGGGNSRNCKLLKNHFGIVGKNNVLATHGVKTRYKQYKNDIASYVDFCELMKKKKFYSSMKGSQNLQKWIEAISKTGYSEYPEQWKKQVNIALKSVNLHYK